MPRRPRTVVPFRRKPRLWTRPQDFGHDPGPPPKRPKPPGGPGPRLAAWALIAGLIAAVVGWSAWG